jgi:hypothetical protein
MADDLQVVYLPEQVSEGQMDFRYHFYVGQEDCRTRFGP